MKQILQYLKNNQGHPIFFEDIQGNFPEKSQEELREELSSLVKKGLIYPYENGFYISLYGEQYLTNSRLKNPYQLKGQVIPYERREEYIRDKRSQYWNKWVNKFLLSLDVIKKNHPELERIINIIGFKAIEEIKKLHDPMEFVKDVHAIFNRYDFSLPELRFSTEKEYSIPEFMESVEYAIIESLNRLSKYSPRHQSLFYKSEDYRRVYNRVSDLLDNKESPLKLNKFFNRGEFISFYDIHRYLVPQISIGNNVDEDTNLIKIALNQQSHKIDNFLKSNFPDTFYEGEELDSIISRLSFYIKNDKEGKDILKNFLLSVKQDKLLLSIKESLFLNKEYSGIDFSGVWFQEFKIDNCNLANCNFSSTLWKEAKVTNNNFENSIFVQSNFKDIDSFQDNNIEGCDFSNSSISPIMDINNNIGTPFNFPSLKLTKEEMKEKGFRGKESFDHITVSEDKKVPGYELGAPGTSWVRYIHAPPDSPFPDRLYELFHLHSTVPRKRNIGWIGGKWDEKSKVLYVTEIQSDLLQRTYELNPKYLDKITNNLRFDQGKIKELREFSPLRSKLENYYDGWQYVFMNQAVREARERGAEFIKVPQGRFYKQMSGITSEKVGVGEYYDKVVQPYPHEKEGNWWKIPVNGITKFAEKKLSWQVDMPVKRMKVLEAVDGREWGYWCWIEEGELVLPETLTYDYGFIGIETRKGTELARVVEKEISLEEIAIKDREGFYGEEIRQDKNFTEFILNKIALIEILFKDIQYLPSGTIIEQVKNPEQVDWFRKVNLKKNSSFLKFSLSPIEWEHWRTYIITYIKKFVEIQKETDPGLAGDKELAHDGYTFMISSHQILPKEIREDSDFPTLLQEVIEYFKEYGLGDISRKELSFDYTQNPDIEEKKDDDGEELVNPEGDPIKGEDIKEDFTPKLRFDDYEKEKEGLINQYLEELGEAKKKGDNNKVDQIKRRLDELISLGSKLSWREFRFEIIREDIPWEKMRGGRVGQVDISYGELLTILGPPSVLGSKDGKTQAEWIIYFPEQNQYGTIYDYKEEVQKEEVTDWHIGGTSENIVDLVINVIGKDKDIGIFRLSWKEPSLPGKEFTRDMLNILQKDVQESKRNKYIPFDLHQEFIHLTPLTLEQVMEIKSRLKPSEIDYTGLEFTYFFYGIRDTMYGSVYDLIGVREDGEYEVLAGGLGEPLKELLGSKLSWDSGKGSYKDLRFNYNEDRGQIIHEYEVGDGSGLSPLVMKDIYNTENVVTDFDQDKLKEHSLDWQDRSNLQLGI